MAWFRCPGRKPITPRDFQPTWRSGLKPIEVVQPEGPSFTVDGWGVEWCGWSFRVGFTPREGLVLHDVKLRDGATVRSILKRASLAEMVVPYAHPTDVHPRKNAFDCGEYGIGVLANSLKLGCDCLGAIHYFDAVVNRIDGSAQVIENAICLHEEDAGILWKHTDFRTEETEVRRGRRLVISFIATVGNYEYGFYWHLYLDGTIELDVRLTGIINTAGLTAERSRQGAARASVQGSWAISTSTSSTSASTWRWMVRTTRSSRSTRSPTRLARRIPGTTHSRSSKRRC